MKTNAALFAVVLIWLGGCSFNPDLSRFELCGAEGECPPGFLCLTEEQRCVPECGENCPPPQDAGADAGLDGGTDAGIDGGVDAGTPDAGEDAGLDAGMDAGEDAGMIDAGPELALATMTLPPAIETKPWTHTFVPTGGVGAYSFSIDGGVPSFTLSTAGVLATTAATTPGTFPFSITVEDDLSEVTTGFSLEVRPLLRVASHTLVEGRQGQAYSQQLSATGGEPPYRWVVDGGMPPGGTSLTDGGLLQGAPNASTMVSFGVTVSDSATPPQQASRTVSVETKLLVLLLEVATRAAADGRVGTPYSQPLKAYGGSPAYTWSIQTGTASLPPGITLMQAGSVWSLAGTPTMTGTFPFTLRVVDAVLGSQNVPMSIVVY